MKSMILSLVIVSASIYGKDPEAGVGTSVQKQSNVSKGVFGRLCNIRNIQADTNYLEKFLTSCLDAKPKTLRELSIVVDNRNPWDVEGVMTITAYDLITNKRSGEDVSVPFIAMSGVYSDPLLDIFSEKMESLVSYLGNSNPILYRIKFESNDGSDSTLLDAFYATAIVGGGSNLEISLSAMPLFPMYVVKGDEVDYVLNGPTALVKIGYQYIGKSLYSIGAGGGLLVENSSDTTSSTKVKFTPSLVLSLSKLSDGILRYGVNFVFAYDFGKNDENAYRIGVGLDFGIDVAKLSK